MRIQRSLYSHITHSSHTAILYAVATIILLAISAAAAIAYQQFTNYRTASAATPTPEACFAFTPATGTITNYYTHENNNTANPACSRDVVIPSTIGGVAVTTIGPANNAWNPATATSFAYKSLTSVAIPDSVTTVGDSAFRDNQLTTLTIPESVTTIGDSAFSSSQLTTLTVPDSVTAIGDHAFSVNQLTTLTLGNSVTIIGDGAFSSNDLTTLTIPDSVTAIGSYAFLYNRLTTLTLGDSVTTIGDGAFAANQLTTLTLGNSVTIIGISAFSSNQLTTVTIPSTIESIGRGAFELNQLAYSLEEFECLMYGCEANDWSTSDQQSALAAIHYVRLVTSDGQTPAGLQDGVVFDSCDLDGSGNWADTCNYGGHLINPAPLTLNYVSSQDQTIHQQLTITGTKSDDSYLANYLIKDGPTIPAAADPYNPTPEEQAAIQQALAAYHRIGSSVTLTLPTIDGYITPEPRTRTFVLGAATNEERVTYLTSQEANQPSAGENEQSGSGLANSDADNMDASTDGGRLAATGASVYAVGCIAILVIVAGGYSLWRRLCMTYVS